MRNFVKRFDGFINEEEQPDFVAHLKKMRRSGLIDQSTYLEKIIKFSEENSIDPSTLFEPEDSLIKLDTAYEEVEHETVLDTEELLRNWRGPKGERVIIATGEVGEADFDLSLRISNGAKVRFFWTEWGWRPGYYVIKINGRSHELGETAYDEISDAFHDVHDDFHQYMHELLSALVSLTYEDK